MEKLVGFIKYLIFFLIFSYIFMNIEMKKAIFIATVSYVGPKAIDGFYYKIKETLISFKDK